MKDLNYYLSLDYPVVIEKVVCEGELYFSATIRELPGLTAFGDTLEEAYEAALFAREDWLSFSLDKGHKINEPVPVEFIKADKE